MNYPHVAIDQDRSIAVPPGHKISTGYVAVGMVDMACSERMAVGDVDRAYQKRLQLGEHQSWPCPRGYWNGQRFVIEDGRHEYIAALMLGQSHILVAWVEIHSTATDKRSQNNLEIGMDDQQIRFEVFKIYTDMAISGGASVIDLEDVDRVAKWIKFGLLPEDQDKP